MWYMHDGAPAHFNHVVQDFLNNTYPLGFYLWRHLKSLVYEAPVDNEGDFTIALFMSVGLSETTPASLNGCRGLRV
jgi:hypothetical protein